jgi:signal peptidase
MKRLVEYLGLTVAIAVMLIAVMTYLAPHFGWRVDVVGSGSMAPALRVGSLVVTRPVDPEQIEVGDIITFNPSTIGENPVSHRVAGIGRNSPLYFITKGDASADDDPFTVPADDVIGRICLHTPYVGYIVAFLKTQVGFVFALVIPSLIIITMYFWSVRSYLVNRRKARGRRGVAP